MATRSKRFEPSKQTAKSSIGIELMLVFSLVGLLVSMFAMSKGIDMSPGFF